MNNKSYNYKQFISKNKNLNLEKTHELCVKELVSQQTKRDHVIGFYIAVLGIVIPGIMHLEIPLELKSIAFFVLFSIGFLFSLVVIRYRYYKGIYWVTCEVLLKLYNFNQNEINSKMIKSLFHDSLSRYSKNILRFKKQKVNYFLSIVKSFKSAETILFEILVFITSAVLSLGVLLAFNSFNYVIILSIFSGLFSFVFCNVLYFITIFNLYDMRNDKVEKKFEGAWFLHFFID